MHTVQTLANTEADIKQRQSFQRSELMKTLLLVDFLVFCLLLINIGRLGWQDILRKVMFSTIPQTNIYSLLSARVILRADQIKDHIDFPRCFRIYFILCYFS